MANQAVVQLAQVTVPLHGTTWPRGKTLRYRIVSFPTNPEAPGSAQVATIIANAFQRWVDSAGLPLTVKPVAATDPCDISISWTQGPEIDGFIAGADFPPGPAAAAVVPNRITFNSALVWRETATTPGTFSLMRIALHEIGHAIGLDHSTSDVPVMTDSIRGGQNGGLSGADDNAAIGLYTPAPGLLTALSPAAIAAMARRTISCGILPPKPVAAPPAPAGPRRQP